LQKLDFIVRIQNKTDHGNKLLCLTRKDKESVNGLISLTRKTLKEAKAGISPSKILKTPGGPFAVSHKISYNIKDFGRERGPLHVRRKS